MWGLVAAIAALLANLLHVAFAYEGIRLVFAPKVPLLGLIIAAGTFQYRIWREIADHGQKHITDPQWLEFERRVVARRAAVTAGTAGGIEAAELQRWEVSLKEWKASNAEVARWTLQGSLPHHVALLGNFLFIGLCLLLSSAADATLFLVGRDIQWLRETSSALFVVLILPFLEGIVRYWLALHFEFRRDRKWFKEQYDKARRGRQ